MRTQRQRTAESGCMICVLAALAVIALALSLGLQGCGGLSVERGVEFQDAQASYHGSDDRHEIFAMGVADMELNLGLLEFLAYLHTQIEKIDDAWQAHVLVQVGLRFAEQFSALVELDVQTEGEMLICVKAGSGQDLRRLCHPLRRVDALEGETVEGEWTAPEP